MPLITAVLWASIHYYIAPSHRSPNMMLWCSGREDQLGSIDIIYVYFQCQFLALVTQDTVDAMMVRARVTSIVIDHLALQPLFGKFNQLGSVQF